MAVGTLRAVRWTLGTLAVSFGVCFEAGDEFGYFVLREPPARLSLVESEGPAGIFEVGVARSFDQGGEIT